jgi:hypothetical protein
MTATYGSPRRPRKARAPEIDEAAVDDRVHVGTLFLDSEPFAHELDAQLAPFERDDRP